MKLWILDPGLQGLAGHHYELDRALTAECARRGIDVRIAAHKDVNGDAARLPVERVFSHSIYDEVTGCTLAAVRAQSANDFANCAWTFERDDVVLMHSVVRAHFFALSDWYENLSQRPRCVVLHTVGSYGAEETKGMYAWSRDFRAAAERLTRAGGTKVIFGAANEPLRHDWEVHSGQKARVHPIPCPVIVRPSEHAVPRFAFLGGARTEKGFELLPDVARTVLRHTKAELLIQIAPIASTSLAAIAQLVKLADASPRIRLFHGEATSDDYRRLLASGGVILHPYDPLRYRVRGSGLFFEAMASGLPVIVPAHTWMADEWQNLGAGGAAFDDWSADSIAEAIVRVADEYEAHRTSSARAAGVWNATHSIRSFVDFVMGGP